MRTRAIIACLIAPGITSLCVMSGCAHRPAYRSVSPSIHDFEPFSMPLHLDEHSIAHVVVPTSAGDLNLILDTGADHAVLLFSDAPVIDRLERIGSEFKSDARGGIERAPVYRIDEITLGSLRFSDVRAPVEAMVLPDFMKADGVLGRGLLEGMTLLIDGPGGQIGVLPPFPIFGHEDPGAWLAAPLLETHNGPVVGMRIDGSKHTLRVVLDTGAIAFSGDQAYGIVELPPDLAASPELVEGRPVYVAQDVRIGDANLGPMKFFVMDHSQPPNTNGFLGNVLLRDWRVLIAPVEERVFFIREN